MTWSAAPIPSTRVDHMKDFLDFTWNNLITTGFYMQMSIQMCSLLNINVSLHSTVLF